MDDTEVLMELNDRFIEVTIDQVVVHVDGDASVVSARTPVQPGRYSRYADSYERRDGRWTCYHARVWRLQQS